MLPFSDQVSPRESCTSGLFSFTSLNTKPALNCVSLKSKGFPKDRIFRFIMVYILEFPMHISTCTCVNQANAKLCFCIFEINLWMAFIYLTILHIENILLLRNLGFVLCSMPTKHFYKLIITFCFNLHGSKHW